LGFVEAEGCFHMRKNGLIPEFLLGQSNKDLPLMLGIKEFFNNLGDLGDVVLEKHYSSSEMVYLSIHRYNYLIKYLIPFFDSLI
jgi:hypothetical protein